MQDRSSNLYTAAVNPTVRGYLVNNPTGRYFHAAEVVYAKGDRNSARPPGVNSFDLAPERRVNITERSAFEFRAEAYNAFDRPRYLAG